jgi:hypothetical protein
MRPFTNLLGTVARGQPIVTVFDDAAAEGLCYGKPYNAVSISTAPAGTDVSFDLKGGLDPLGTAQKRIPLLISDRR